MHLRSNHVVARLWVTLLYVALQGALISGCVSSRDSGLEVSAAKSRLSSDQAKGLQAEAMELWKKRDDKASLESALERLEKIADAGRGDYQTYLYLCRGHYLLSDGHLEDKERRKAIWEKGVFWGERALATNKKFRTKVKDKGLRVEDALDQLDKGQVEALYWTAVNLGKWARLAGLATLLENKNRIRKMVTRVEELKADYFYGAAPRYWGVYYAVAPSFAGGDIKKSESEFQRSLKMAKDYFGTHVLIAENLAPKKSDQELFKKHLNMVINGDPMVIPEIAPEQRIEQQKAKKMLAAMEDYF